MNEAFLALAASVVMHVTWNLIARRLPARTDGLWWVLAAHLVLLGPIGLYGLWTAVDWGRPILALMAISATANAVYFLALRTAYRRAPVAFVYPLVRSSPLLIAIWSWWLFGNVPQVTVWVGILISLGGLFWLASTAHSGATENELAAVPWTLLAMLATSVYSISDAAATDAIDGFAGLIGMVSIGFFVSWVALGIQRVASGQDWIPPERPLLWMLTIGGLCAGLAYALVIHSMRFVEPAVAVTLTNAGIMLATIASIALLKERFCWRSRLLASIVIAAGLVVTGRAS